LNSQLPKGLDALFNRSRRATTLLALGAAALGSQVLAQSASARSARGSSGGSALGGSGTNPTSSSAGTTTSSTATTTTSAVGSGVVTLDTPLEATGGGITLTLGDFGTQNKVVKLAGSAPPADAGATVDIDVSSASGIESWSEVTTATVGVTGAFSATWVPTMNTTVAVKALLATSLTPAVAGTTNSTTPGATSASGGGALTDTADTATTASSDVSTSIVTLPIFKDAIATFYGPGLWGRHTACGQVLKRATLGVASRTLKCGTMVAVQYGGRELSVPVIDRGPFANRASWDLTQATARLIGMRDTAVVGTLSPAPSLLVAAVRTHR
jgi:rare lipoprotein A